MTRIYIKSVAIFYVFALIQQFPGTAFAKRISIDSIGNVYVVDRSKAQPRMIRKYNALTKSSTTFYHIPDNCIAHGSYLNQKGNKLAIFGVCSLTSEKGTSPGVSNSHCFLSVINIQNRKSMATFRDACYFAFSPGGSSIVLVSDFPGKNEGIQPPPEYVDQVYVYNFDIGQRKTIDTLGMKLPLEGMDVNWSGHDGNIYLRMDRVLKYDIKRQKSEIVSYRGIYFSPDGKYYATSPCMEGCNLDWKPPCASGCGIYRTIDNQEMEAWEIMLLKKCVPKYPALAFKFWSKKLNAGVFSVVPSDTKNVIFDVGQGQIIGEFSGKVIGTNAQGTLVAVYPEGKDGKSPWDTSKIEIIDLTKFKK